MNPHPAPVGGSVTSTAGNALLSFSDPGHLLNATFTLPDPLRTGTYSRTLTFTLATTAP